MARRSGMPGSSCAAVFGVPLPSSRSRRLPCTRRCTNIFPFSIQSRCRSFSQPRGPITASSLHQKRGTPLPGIGRQQRFTWRSSFSPEWHSVRCSPSFSSALLRSGSGGAVRFRVRMPCNPRSRSRCACLIWPIRTS